MGAVVGGVDGMGEKKIGKGQIAGRAGLRLAGHRSGLDSGFATRPGMTVAWVDEGRVGEAVDAEAMAACRSTGPVKIFLCMASRLARPSRPVQR